MDTEDYREAARRSYANEHCQIDDDAPIADAPTGAWVQAWVFVEGTSPKDDA